METTTSSRKSRRIFLIFTFALFSLLISACATNVNSNEGSAGLNTSSSMPSEEEYQKAWNVGKTYGSTALSLDDRLSATKNPDVLEKFSTNPNFTLVGLEMSFGFDGANPNPCGKGGQAAYPDSVPLTLAFEGGCFVGFGYPLKQHTE